MHVGRPARDEKATRGVLTHQPDGLQHLLLGHTVLPWLGPQRSLVLIFVAVLVGFELVEVGVDVVVVEDPEQERPKASWHPAPQ